MGPTNIVRSVAVSFDKTAYELEYQKKNVWQCKLNFNRKTDSDIIEKLMSVPNRLGYIKKLIRADIERRDANADN